MTRREDMKIGYIRVSTIRQAQTGTSLDDQRKLLESKGAETIYTDAGISGKNTDRPGLQAMQKALHPGDMVIVSALDRLGRNLRDIATLIQAWNDKEITLIAVREGVNTSTPTGVMLAQIMAMIAELERNLIRERTAAGRAARIAQHKPVNRPRKWSDRDAKRIAKMTGAGLTITEIAQATGKTRQTIYRMLDRANEIKAEVQA
jgi:DNA invertase Pin-like site-specific DNA recombinase